MKPKLSIISVHYRAKEELFSCLESIYESQPEVAYEVIVVDNDERQTIKKKLKQKYPWVKYVRSPGNIGFGRGNNLGAKETSGKYLFFLNPDTLVKRGAIDILMRGMEEKSPGIIAPQLLNKDGKIYPFQCTGKLTPMTALIALSVLNKLFPNNPVCSKFWLSDWDKNSTREVEFVHGSAFMISKKDFKALGGFDENFFLYFEDTDLCLRARKIGLNILFYPKAKVIHLGERSRQHRKKALGIFKKSRRYFLVKHYGFLSGYTTQAALLLMEEWKAVSVVLAIILLSLALKIAI